MTLQTSGPIKFSEIHTEFGGVDPISLSEYYAGGVYVPSGTSGTNGAVPTSGTVALSKFYGTSKVIYTPAGGSSAGTAEAIGDFATYPGGAFVTIYCTLPAVWTWTRTGNTNATASVSSGGTADTVSFSLPSSNSFPRTATFTVSATAAGITRYWTVQLDTETNQ